MNATPEEVLKEIANDFRTNGLTHESAAEKIGYSNKQTVSNLLTQKKYFSPLQAAKFNKAFGYSIKYLTTGEGNLYEENILKYEGYQESSPRDLLTFQPGASELGLLRSYFRRVIEAWGNPTAKKVLNGYQLLNSCADVPTLLALFAEIETNLLSLERDSRSKDDKK